MTPIEKGTFVNSTHMSYTFLCSGCITGDSLSFSNTATGASFGWAYSTEAMTDTTTSDATLTYHAAGYGAFGVTFSGAESAQYATWAAMASASTTSNSTSGSNSTTTSSGTNSTTSTGSSQNVTATVSNTTYDYIVAGAGAAGIIVAERLAESGASVLLIERGEASTYASGGKDVMSWNSTITQYDVPALGYYLTDMNDTSEYCTDTASEAGCLLGGSTMINALMFVRPQEIDFDDEWPTGWKWNDVASSAARFYQRNPGTISPSADGKRYDQGAYDVLSQFLGGEGFSSVDALAEPNKKHNVFSHPPWNIQDGLRAGPVKTYLPLAKALPNFHLQLNTKVIRAVRNSSLITGLEVESESGTRQIININTGGKVILSSGTLSTPRILFNSGIGPTAQIQTVQSGSVAVTLPTETDWINLPVGQGVKDHPIVTIKFTTKTGLAALNTTAFTAPTANSTEMFARGTGVLVEAGQRLNFWTSVSASDGSTRYIQGTCNAPAADTIQIKVYLTHGLTSTGVLGITAAGTTEFTTEPWLTTAMDKEALASFLDTLLGYSRAANSSLTFLPSTGIPANATGADLLPSYISGSHFVGSAKMGEDDGRVANGTSVVDLDTKVYGTQNLFVVDASMHPDLPTGNTQTIVMVAAEAAAARILALNNATTAGSDVSGVIKSAVVSATSVASSVAATTTAAAATAPTTATGSAVSVSSASDPDSVSYLASPSSVYPLTSAGTAIFGGTAAGSGTATAVSEKIRVTPGAFKHRPLHQPPRPATTKNGGREVRVRRSVKEGGVTKASFLEAYV